MKEDISRVYGCLRVLLYAGGLIRLQRPLVINPYLYAAARVRDERFRKRLRVRRTSLHSMQSQLAKRGIHDVDMNAAILVSEKSGFSFNLRSGQWEDVLCHCDGDIGRECTAGNSPKKQRKWVMVYLCPGVEEGQCQVSPLLYHNLHRHPYPGHRLSFEFADKEVYSLPEPVQKMVMLWNTSQGSRVQEEVRSSVSAPAPPVADEIHVKIVESPKYSCGSGEEVESLLKEYFSTFRVVSQDDVIPIPIPSYLAHEFVPGNTIIPPSYMFIKISRVRSSAGTDLQHSCRVAVGSTSLYLTGTTHASLPFLEGKFDSEGEIDFPPIIRHNCVKLRNILSMEAQMRAHLPWPSKELQLSTEAQKSPIRGSKKPQENFKSASGTYGTGNSVEAGPVRQGASATVLLLGPEGCGSEEVVELAAAGLGLAVIRVNCWRLKGDTSGATEAKLCQAFVRAGTHGPSVLALLHVHCLAKDPDGGEDVRVVEALKAQVAKLSLTDPPIYLVATAPSRTDVSDELWSLWSYQETVGDCSLSQRATMLHWLLPSTVCCSPNHVQTLAQRTAGFLLGDFKALKNAASRRCLERMASEGSRCQDISDPLLAPRQPPLLFDDLLQALDELQTMRSEALGAPRIPQVRWSEVGGLEEAKRQIVDTIQLPLRHPALISGRLRRSGVLLYGPPGTGKTLLAKAVATECGLNFMSVKGPELLNMYVGQSEENVRQVFSRARAAAPCVIFFDELDSLAPNRGRSGDSGGVMDRIVSALLAELDGVANSADVFVLAATNRPDLIDPALLRPGRFEKLVFLGVCEDQASQVKVLHAITSKLPLADSVCLEQVAAGLPRTLTGADLYSLCSDALYAALHHTISHIQAGQVQAEEAKVVVGQDDLEAAALRLVPSVSPRDLAHYKTLHTTSR